MSIDARNRISYYWNRLPEKAPESLLALAVILVKQYLLRGSFVATDPDLRYPPKHH